MLGHAGAEHCPSQTLGSCMLYSSPHSAKVPSLSPHCSQWLKRGKRCLALSAASPGGHSGYHVPRRRGSWQEWESTPASLTYPLLFPPIQPPLPQVQLTLWWPWGGRSQLQACCPSKGSRVGYVCVWSVWLRVASLGTLDTGARWRRAGPGC